jgi:ABC-type nitrate/sulfonate/bicarbonate transport system substrate-binding protein
MKNTRFWLIVFAAILLVVAGTIINSLWPARKIRIAYLPIYVDLPLFVAQEEGLFNKQGLQVELHRFAKSPEIGDALANGQVDFAASIAFANMLINESRDPGNLKAFIIDSETPENYLSSFVVLADSGITTLEDLRGKVVGTFPGPTAETFCKMILAKHGIDASKDLKQFVPLDIGMHLDALSSRKVDALFTYEPTATQAVLERKAVKLVAGAVEREIINPWQAGVWVVRNKFAEKHLGETQKVIATLYEAVDHVRANPLDAKIALSKYTSIKQSVARATPDIPFAKRWEANMEALQRHADMLTDQKVISKKIDTVSLLVPSEWLTYQP